jgi:hypothetical protein
MFQEVSSMRTFLKVIHWFIIVNFLLEIFYAADMVFFKVGGGGPLFARAGKISFELMMTRRLYAIECWIAIAGLSIYLAITEIYPRWKAELLSKS